MKSIKQLKVEINLKCDSNKERAYGDIEYVDYYCTVVPKGEVEDKTYLYFLDEVNKVTGERRTIIKGEVGKESAGEKGKELMKLCKAMRKREMRWREFVGDRKDLK